MHVLLGQAPGCLLYPCSTLDPVLRLEQKGINPTGLALVFAVLLYLTATPGEQTSLMFC